MFKSFIFMMVSMLFLQGCVQQSVKQSVPAEVTSTPSGAMVYANEKKLGITPLRYTLFEAFPAGWKNSTYQAEGRLIVKKDGCENYTLEVSDFILSKPIHAILDCTKKKPDTLTKSASFSETEERLKKVDALYNKKHITEEEYKATRKRILNDI